MFAGYNSDYYNKAFPAQSNKTVHSLYDAPLTTWSIDDIRMARDEQSNGRFQLCSDLSRSMMTDSAFSGIIEKRLSAFVRAQRVVKPCNPNNPHEVAAAELTTEMLDLMLPKTELKTLVRYYLMIGFGLGTLDWEFSKGFFVPVVRYLNPRHAWYNIIGRHTVLTTFDGVRTVAPGDHRWLLISNWKHGEAAGFIATLGEDWYYRNIALRDLADFRAAHSWPLIEIKTPAGLDPNEQARLEQDVISARASKVIFTKMSHESQATAESSIEIHDGSGGVTPDIFINSVTMYNDRFASTVLGSNIAQDVGQIGGAHGSYAAKDSAEDGLTKLLVADFDMFDRELSLQLIAPFYERNLPGMEYGRLETVLEETDMSLEKAQLFSTVATAVKTLSDSGVTVKNINDFIESLGLNVTLSAGAKLQPGIASRINKPTKAKGRKQ